MGLKPWRRQDLYYLTTVHITCGCLVLSYFVRLLSISRNYADGSFNWLNGSGRSNALLIAVDEVDALSRFGRSTDYLPPKICPPEQFQALK